MKGTNSKGRSPWKVKKESRRAVGIVIPNGAILVNQGLGKVKLEEDYIPVKNEKFAASMETENDVNSLATSTIGDAVEDGFTEEFTVTVTKVEPDNQMSSPERLQIEEDANCCSSSCREEIESLKCKVDKQNQVIREMKSGLRNAVMSLMTCCNDEEEDDDDSRRHSSSDFQSQGECTVKQISLQVDKQNQVIRELKTGLRNAGMSLMTFCKDEEENDNEGGCHSSSDPQSQGETTRSRSGTGSVDETGGHNPNESFNQSCASLGSSFISEGWQSAEYNILENEEVVLANEDITFVPDHDDHEDEGEFESEQKYVDEDNEEDDQDHHDVHDNEDSDFMPDQDQDEDDEDDSDLDNAGEGDDNQEDDRGNEEDDLNRNEDSSQVPPSSSNREEEDDEYNPRGNAIKRRRLQRKTDKIKGSINNFKGKKMYQCSKCNRKFKFEIVMRDHQQRVHSKVKPSKSECHLCRKTFSDYRNLRRHVLSVHEGVRFKCEYCPREFAKLENVRYHEDTVHKGISHTQQCKVCGKYYASSMSLHTHMNNKHEKKSGPKASKTTQKKPARRLLKQK